MIRHTANDQPEGDRRNLPRVRARPCNGIGLVAAPLSLLLSLSLAACVAERPEQAPDGQARDTVTVFDSAGVLMVRNPAPAWEPGTGWRVDPEPILVLGTLDGEEPYMFSQVEWAGRLSDGRLFVVDRGLAQIRIYDAGGRHLHSFGGHGEGPGEFGTAPRVVATPGDTLLAFDRGGFPPNLFPPRFAWFAADGSLIRTAPFTIVNPADARYLRPNLATQHLFADGTMVAYGQFRAPVEWVRDRSGSGYVTRPSVLPGEVDTPEYMILILSAGGSTRVEVEGNHPRGQLIQSDSELEVNPFHPRVGIAAEGLPVRVHISHPEEWAVRTFDETGTLTRVVALAAPREAIARDAARRLDARFTLPDSLPPIRSIVADAEGHLWLEERSDGLGRGSGYQILDPSGRWLGRVERPEAVRAVFEIGADYVLTLEGDEWGVQRVKMYPLIKEP